jgi:hypothetical protein
MKAPPDLHAELRRLLAQEARRPDPPERIQQEVRLRLDGLIARRVRPTRSLRHASLRLAGAGRTFLVVGGLGAALGGVGWWAAQHRDGPSTSVRAQGPAFVPPVEPARELPPSSAAMPNEEVPTPPTQKTSAQPRPPPPASPAGSDEETSLARERALIEQSRTALRAGEPSRALGLLHAHERRYPGGLLVEERMGLQVEALAAAQRFGEARSLAERFHAIFPTSPLWPVLQAALRAEP